MDNIIFLLLSSALWGKPVTTKQITNDIYQELRFHAVEALLAPLLSNLDMTDSLRQIWRKTIYHHLAYQANYQYAMKSMAIPVPFVVLKGSSAAQYYLHPELRTMGDIDIMTSHEDYYQSIQRIWD